MDPFTPLAGWRLVPPLEGDQADVVDPTGRVRARVVGIRTQADLRGRQVLPVLLPDGRETTLTNGTSVWGPRRTRTRGLFPLGPVSYVLEHRTGRRARLLRDGVLLARLLREPESHEDLQRRHVPGRTVTPLVDLAGPLGEDDQLALAVTGLVLRPGRWTQLFRVVDVFWATG
ncbi:MAG: hypothetical protein JWQ53_2339 [Klenkia sp.]|nr:hypothetical protein [Klenkia sp.]